MTSQTQSIITTVLIKAPSDIYIRYDINNNWVKGIREFLLNVPITCFLTNYELIVEKTNRRLEDNISIFDIGLADFDIISIQPCLYTKNQLIAHIERLKYILNENFPCFNKNGPISPNLISKDKNDLIKQAKEYFEKLNDIKKTIVKEESSTTMETSQIEKNKEEDKKEERAKEIDSKVIQESMKNLIESYQKIQDTDFLTFHFNSYPQSALYENTTQSHQKKYQCLYSIVQSLSNQIISISNPDEIYIEVSTLENKTLYITCNEHGFYINNSHMSDNVLFIDNTPHKVSCSSFTLVGLLSQASPQFGERFNKLVSQVIESEPLLFVPSPEMTYNWLSKIDSNSEDSNDMRYEYIFEKYNKDDYDNNKKLSRLNKEWNEEFLAFIDINFNNDPIQNITKEKLLNEYYTLFKRTAIEGVKLIREKKLSPFTFFESPKTNEFYYMYSNIIFTVLEDSYLTNRTYSTDELKQSYLGSNLDLKHVNFFNKYRSIFGLNKLYTPLNCIVHYMGLRCHCQVITPGVIFNSDNLVCYGEGEEGVVKFNEEFHKEIEKLYKRLNIKEVKVEDKNKKVVSLYGNPEIKGVIGVDKRNYIFDMIHLLPRDLNYYKENDEQYNEDNKGCLIRPEVILKYKEKLIIDEIEKRQIKADNIEERNKAVKEIVDKLNTEIHYNTNIGTKLKKLTIVKENDSEINKDIVQLKKLSEYLKKDLIDAFISDIMKEVDNETAPIDCLSLSEYLHSYGINCRYLGEIYNRIGRDNWLRTLIERDIIRRAAKHLFNDVIEKTPSHLINEVTCHFLNCIFAPYELLVELNKKKVIVEDGEIIFEENKKASDSKASENEKTSSSHNTNNHDNKKKKKKNKGKNKQSSDKDETTIQFLFNDLINSKIISSTYQEPDDTIASFFLSPKDIWNKITEIAKVHFNYTLSFKPNTYINPSINKHGLLRDFCKTVGLQIKAIDYSLRETEGNQRLKNFTYSSLPFKKISIVQFNPVTKDYLLPSVIHLPLYEEALQLSKTFNYKDAAEKYRQLIYTSNEIYGPINKYSAFGYKKLAEIAFFERDFVSGMSILFKAITIYEKTKEWDSSEVINCYTLFSTFSHFLGDSYMSFTFISRALEIAFYTMPKNHPELITKYISMGMYYVDQGIMTKGKYIVELCSKICNDYYTQNDKDLQRPLLLVSQLGLKCYETELAIETYEKYLNLLSGKEKEGKIVLESLKTFEKEVKKNINGKKVSKEKDKDVYNELMRTVVNPLYWDDLEKPLMPQEQTNKV